MLAVGFIGNGLGNLGIGFRQGAGHPGILHDKNLTRASIINVGFASGWAIA